MESDTEMGGFSALGSLLFYIHLCVYTCMLVHWKAKENLGRHSLGNVHLRFSFFVSGLEVLHGPGVCLVV